MEKFCLEFFPALFDKEFSDAHRQAISRIEAAVLKGEQLAQCLPRGSGKTTLAKCAVIWAVLYGHSPYVVLVAATDKAATKLLESIKDTLRYNERLRDSFPKIIYPIIALNGEPRAAPSQTYNGEPTSIAWSKDRIIFPCVLGVVGSEAVIETASITGEIRGKNYTKRNGVNVRPTFCLVDDPQTRKSARSSSDTQERLDTILGDIGYLAGPGKSNGCVVNATIIRKGDLADRLTDRELHPDWHGLKIPFFRSLPNDTALSHWQGEYDRLRRQALIDDRSPDEAHAYYAKHREIMDAGADVYWPSRYNPQRGEISAVEHGMGMLLKDRASFLAEYQNDPEQAHDVSPVAILTEQELQRKVSGLPQYTCPKDTGFVVGMIDVHPGLLYYSLVAVKSDFSGSVIDYGVWPEQPSRDFSHTRPHTNLTDIYGGSEEANITQGLIDLTDRLCGREYPCVFSERHLSISRLLIDTGYKPDSVLAAMQRSDHKAVLMGSRGVGLTPESRPFSEYDLSPQRVRQYGPRDNCRWYVPVAGHSAGIVRFDKYHWLSSLHARFVTPVPEPSAWELHGDKYADHRMIASHLQGQQAVEVHARGRSIIQWKADRSREDHWLDCLVGCMVAASMLGCELPGRPVPEAPPKKIKLADLFGQQKKGRR